MAVSILFERILLVNFAYHLALIVTAGMFFFWSFNKYPGNHIREKPKGSEQIIFQCANPISRQRIYFEYRFITCIPIKKKEKNAAATAKMMKVLLK